MAEKPSMRVELEVYKTKQAVVEKLDRELRCMNMDLQNIFYEDLEGVLPPNILPLGILRSAILDAMGCEEHISTLVNRLADIVAKGAVATEGYPNGMTIPEDILKRLATVHQKWAGQPPGEEVRG